MKECPTCKRTYADETTTFCLDDGSLLSAPFDPQATLILNHPPQVAQSSSDAPAAAPAARSRRSLSLFIAAAILALVGLTDSIYLTIKHFTGGPVQCTITSGCEEVLSSQYATIHGVPLASLGALAYFTAFSLATLAIFGSRLARNLLFLLAALMLAVSIRLFIIQASDIKAFCQFCLLSAATTLLLTICVTLERFLPPGKKETRAVSK